MTMLAVLAFTGMRSGELQRLRKEDLDLAGNLAPCRHPGKGSRPRPDSRDEFHSIRASGEYCKICGSDEALGYSLLKPVGNIPKCDHWISTKKLNERFEDLARASWRSSWSREWLHGPQSSPFVRNYFR
jgi:hypothetical protein